MIGRETADRAWQSQERDCIDSDLESSYDDRQNGGIAVDDLDDDPPDDDEFCLSCGDLLEDASDGWNGRCENCADAKERVEAEILIAANTRAPRFVYLYDVYVLIAADSKEDADWLLQDVEHAVDTVPGASLSLFDAYGITDAETGEELRQVY